MTGTWKVDTGTISTYLGTINKFKKNAFSGHKILHTYVSRNIVDVTSTQFLSICTIRWTSVKLLTKLESDLNSKFGELNLSWSILIDPRNKREVVEMKPRSQWREAIKQGAILNWYWRDESIVIGRSRPAPGICIGRDSNPLFNLELNRSH